MPCSPYLTTRCKAALIGTVILSGPVWADTFTVTGDPNHRAVARSAGPAVLPEAPRHRRLGLTPAPGGNGTTDTDVSVRQIEKQGYVDVMLFDTGPDTFTALDAQGREMVIRFDPRRSLITKVTPRSEIRARRMAGR